MVLASCRAGPSLAALLMSGTAFAQPATYQWATSVERLDTEQAEIERRLGPGFEDRFYQAFLVGGCRVSYQFGGGRVLASRAEVSQRCQPRPERRTIAPQTTLSDVAEAGSGFKAQCLDGCPGHPEVQTATPLSVATRLREIDEWGGYYLTYSGADAEAQAAWRAAIDGDPALASAPDRYVFPENPPADVARLIARVRVREVEARFTPLNRPPIMSPPDIAATPAAACASVSDAAKMMHAGAP